MLWFCSVADAQQRVTPLDPETREELRRSIEKLPDADAEIKREILRRIEATPKLLCAIESITVYTDGIVSRATLKSDLAFDSRVSILGASLSLVRKARLTDSEKSAWKVPPWENHYLFVPISEAFSVLIPKAKTISLIHVDSIESPRLVRVNPPRDVKVNRPTELTYVIAGYSTAYRADFKDYVSVYLLGRGKSPVEWKDGPVPPGMKTGIADPKK